MSIANYYNNHKICFYFTIKTTKVGTSLIKSLLLKMTNIEVKEGQMVTS